VAIINLWLLILKHGQCEIGKGWFQALSLLPWEQSHSSRRNTYWPGEKKTLKKWRRHEIRGTSSSLFIFRYMVHFQSWSKAFDRWVTKDLLMKQTEENKAHQLKLAKTLIKEKNPRNVLSKFELTLKLSLKIVFPFMTAQLNFFLRSYFVWKIQELLKLKNCLFGLFLLMRFYVICFSKKQNRNLADFKLLNLIKRQLKHVPGMKKIKKEMEAEETKTNGNNGGSLRSSARKRAVSTSQSEMSADEDAVKIHQRISLILSSI